MTTTPLIPSLLIALAIGAPAMQATAQNDELLVVEKRKDLAARNRMLAHLGKIIVTVNFADLNVLDVARYLTAASGNTVDVIVSRKTVKPEDMPRLTLALSNVRLTNLMSMIEAQTDLRFTFNSGLIVIKPKAEVKEFSYLKIYDVRAAVFAAPVFIPPKLGLRPPDEEGGFVGGTEEEPQPINGYDIDKLVEMVRSNAVPDTWDKEGISIDSTRGMLMVRQTVRGHRETQEILEKLGAIPPVRRIVVRRPAPRPLQVTRPKPAKKAAEKPAKKK